MFPSSENWAFSNWANSSSISFLLHCCTNGLRRAWQLSCYSLICIGPMESANGCVYGWQCKQGGFLKDMEGKFGRSKQGKLGVLQTFKLYEANELKRKSRLIQERLLHTSPKVLHPLPQSINPSGMISTKNMWNELDRYVRKYSISSVEDLKNTL